MAMQPQSGPLADSETRGGGEESDDRRRVAVSMRAHFDLFKRVGEGGPGGEDLVAERVVAAVFLDAPLAQHRLLHWVLSVKHFGRCG